MGLLSVRFRARFAFPAICSNYSANKKKKRRINRAKKTPAFRRLLRETITVYTVVSRRNQFIRRISKFGRSLANGLACRPLLANKVVSAHHTLTQSEREHRVNQPHATAITTMCREGFEQVYQPIPRITPDLAKRRTSHVLQLPRVCTRCHILERSKPGSGSPRCGQHNRPLTLQEKKKQYVYTGPNDKCAHNIMEVTVHRGPFLACFFTSRAYRSTGISPKASLWAEKKKCTR